MHTENMVFYFEDQKVNTGLDLDAFREAMRISEEVFPEH